jgi:hypothetical protein
MHFHKRTNSRSSINVTCTLFKLSLNNLNLSVKIESRPALVDTIQWNYNMTVGINGKGGVFRARNLQVPHHIPVPVPVHHPVAVPVPQIVKVPHHVPVEIEKPVPVELPQQVPLYLSKPVALPHPVPVPQPIAINRPVYYPVPHAVPYSAHNEYEEQEHPVSRPVRQSHINKSGAFTFPTLFCRVQTG